MINPKTPQKTTFKGRKTDETVAIFDGSSVRRPSQSKGLSVAGEGALSNNSDNRAIIYAGEGALSKHERAVLRIRVTAYQQHVSLHLEWIHLGGSRGLYYPTPGLGGRSGCGGRL